MMSDKLPESDVKQVAQIFEIKFEQLKDKLLDLKDDISKSDLHFDRRIDKLEEKFDKREVELKDQAVDISTLQEKTNRSSGFIAVVVGSIAAIFVSLIQRFLNL